jgi:hypothetical protein
VLHVDSLEAGDERVSVQFGVFHTCEEFISKARVLKHPFDGHSSIDDGLLGALFSLFTRGPAAIAAEREATFVYYEQLAEQSKQLEKDIHDGLSSARAEIMKEKNFLLFKVMCADAGIRDPFMAEHYAAGVSLVGEAVVTQDFPPKRREMKMTVTQVMKAAKWTRKVTMAKTGKSSDPLMNDEVWAATKLEIGNQWLRGPFSEAELVESLGPLFVVSRRFGIWQKSTVRVIDDLAESLVNDCFAASEKVDLVGGVDEIAVLARTMLEIVNDTREVMISLGDGSVLSGQLHDSLTLDDARTLVGRCLDLEAAYKQLLVRQSSQWASVIMVFNVESGKDELYMAEVLPFGAAA